MSFLDGLDDEGAPLVPYKARSSEEKQLDRIRTIEDRIYESHLTVLDDMGMARELDPEADANGPPAEWVEKLGPVEARRRWRVAMAMWCNKKNAPVLLEHSKSVVVGILKAREARPVNIQSLKATFIIAAPPKAQNAYPIIDVEAEESGDE